MSRIEPIIAFICAIALLIEAGSSVHSIQRRERERDRERERPPAVRLTHGRPGAIQRWVF